MLLLATMTISPQFIVACQKHFAMPTLDLRGAAMAMIVESPQNSAVLSATRARSVKISDLVELLSVQLVSDGRSGHLVTQTSDHQGLPHPQFRPVRRSYSRATGRDS